MNSHPEQVLCVSPYDIGRGESTNQEDKTNEGNDGGPDGI